MKCENCKLDRSGNVYSFIIAECIDVSRSHSGQRNYYKPLATVGTFLCNECVMTEFPSLQKWLVDSAIALVGSIISGASLLWVWINRYFIVYYILGGDESNWTGKHEVLMLGVLALCFILLLLTILFIVGGGLEIIENFKNINRKPSIVHHEDGERIAMSLKEKDELEKWGAMAEHVWMDVSLGKRGPAVEAFTKTRWNIMRR